MTGAATARVNAVVHNSDHHTHDGPFHRPAGPGSPPAYTSGRRQWSGKRRDGAIDWAVQGPDCAHISHRIEVLAKLRITKGYGAVSSATVDLVQAEKYVTEPDLKAWPYPVQQDEMTDEEGSDDGYPETVMPGIKLRQGVNFNRLDGNLSGISRENVCPSKY
jgi:hypothetical protein